MKPYVLLNRCSDKTFLYHKRFLQENFKILLIINNSSPLFYSLLFCVNLRSGCSIIWKIKKKSHLPVDILIKGRKSDEILFATLKKFFANIKSCEILRTLKFTCVKSSKLQKTLLLEKCHKNLPLYFSSLMQVKKGT